MTFYCPECVIEWWPYMCDAGVCPTCGRGTIQHNGNDATDGVEQLHKAALKVRNRLDTLADFETYYEQREITLNGLDTLPVAEPTRRLAA
jgi:hypothetical protein